MFLFQTGSIRSSVMVSVFRSMLGFYSKLVRLEAQDLYVRFDRPYQFLFQTGSIRSAIFFFPIKRDEFVSIPNWFD